MWESGLWEKKITKYLNLFFLKENKKEHYSDYHFVWQTLKRDLNPSVAWDLVEKNPSHLLNEEM